MNRPDGTIRKDTRVSLYDANGTFICMWIGYHLPEHLGAFLDNEKHWPNLNFNAVYSLRWYYNGEPQKWHVESFGLPLGIGIQTELAMLALLGE